MITIDACVLEKAAFACFGNKLEDSFKRLLFLNIDKYVRENPNCTANQCYYKVLEIMAVERSDFDAAVRAMKTPFQRLAINKFARHGKQHIHLIPADSENWSAWVQTVIEKYPELTIWVNG